jgi:DNA polymerase III subunit epsilon
MGSSPGAPHYAVVDVETSGLSARRHHVLQIGVVVLDEQFDVLQRWVSLVRPARRWLFGVGPTRIHGIRRRDMRAAPAGPAVMREFAALVHGTTVVAHNAAFDTAFLRKAAQRHRVDVRLDPVLCTLLLSRSLDPDRQRSHRLGDLCKQYDVPLIRAHDALSDAEATAGLLPHLVRAQQQAAGQLPAS